MSRSGSARLCPSLMLEPGFLGLGLPLLTQKHPLGRAEEKQRHENDQRYGDQHMDPERWRIGHLDAEDRAHADEAGKEHDEPGSAVTSIGEIEGEPAGIA